MILHVLASGSKGNATYLEIDNHKILIDAGMSYLNLKQLLHEKAIDHLDTILITHDHSDHIKGLKQLQKHFHATVYGPISSKIKNSTSVDELSNLSNIVIKAFEVSHDTEKTYGYIIEGSIKVCYISDCGYLSSDVLNLLLNCDVILLEANHDIELLMKNQKYSWILKQRILGDKGHLSNDQFMSYLKILVSANTKHVIALHLSEENNTPEHVTTILDNFEINTYVAKQDEVLTVIDYEN